ncbi:659_t:CDS:2, partial [Funneliformis geosporum]
QKKSVEVEPKQIKNPPARRQLRFQQKKSAEAESERKLNL